MEKPGPTATLEVPLSGWRGAVATLKGKPQSRLLSGSMIMLVGSGLVTVLNFVYNVVLARMLGPAAFGHAAAAITLIMLVSALTLSFQLVCAKFVAKNEADGAKAGVYRNLHRKAWLIGAVLAFGMVLNSAWISAYLNLPSAWETILLAVGVAYVVPLGAKRGALQGSCSFPRLAGSYVVEALIKTVGAILLVRFGYGVLGVAAAISASVIAAYSLAIEPRELRVKAQPGLPVHIGEGMQAIVFFVGQVVINNIDILLVKHFLAAEPAGVYAAVALVGRVLYYVSWMMVSAMFPISAAAKSNEKASQVLVVPMLLVLSITLVFMGGTALFAHPVLQAVFGPTMPRVGGLESMLSLFAAATGVYCLSVVAMTYEMSRKIANTGWLQLVFSGAIVLGIHLFHSTLWQVIIVQLVTRVLLLIAVTTPFFRTRPRLKTPLEEAA